MTPFDVPPTRPEFGEPQPSGRNTALLTTLAAVSAAAILGVLGLTAVGGMSKPKQLIEGTTFYPQDTSYPVRWVTFYDTEYPQGPWRFERTETLPDGTAQVKNFALDQFRPAFTADLFMPDPRMTDSVMQSVVVNFAENNIPPQDLVRLNMGLGLPDSFADIARARYLERGGR